MANSKALRHLIQESSAYNRFEDIAKLVETGNLAMVPVHPLYVSLLSASSDQVAKIIPDLSHEQRQAMIDLDLWQKDRIDVDSFEYWIEVYSKVEDLKFTQEFVKNENFLIYLKSRVNIYTFDTEDPEYPDHDHYFLTDDMLLLIEYSEEYKYATELKYLIRNLYDKLGVDKAYSLLFKLINDSYSLLEEQEYQNSKSRLRDYGFVDYFEAKEKTFAFASLKGIDRYISSHIALTPEIDLNSKLQNLHSSALTSFNKEIDLIEEELALVKDDKRQDFLNFSFLRLVNSVIVVNNAMKEGSIELSRIGNNTKKFVNLGIDKVRSVQNDLSDFVIFERFDFFDLYRIGHSLIELNKKKLVKSLSPYAENKEKLLMFLGGHFENFLDNSNLDIPKFQHPNGSVVEVSNYNDVQEWQSWVNLFTEIIPYISSFFKSLESLLKQNIHNNTYINYELNQIDFEAVIITTLIRDEQSIKEERLGLNFSELQDFITKYFNRTNSGHFLKDFSDNKIRQMLESFSNRFELRDRELFLKYLYLILKEQLSDYDYDSLSPEDYQHIGGPLLLNGDTFQKDN